MVIPLGTGSKVGDLEIRYALRALDQHGRGVGQVWILGRRRYWMSREVRAMAALAQKAAPGGNRLTKYARVRAKYRLFMDLRDAPERWLLMHDDMFLTRDQDLATFPMLHEGPLRSRVLLMETLGGKYHQVIRATEEELLARGVVKPLSFEVHAPMPVETVMYRAVLDSLPRKFPSPASRTVYGNAMRATADPPFEIEFSRDRKLLAPMKPLDILRACPRFFSVGDGFLDPVGRAALGELYPTPSRWERRR